MNANYDVINFYTSIIGDYVISKLENGSHTSQITSLVNVEVIHFYASIFGDYAIWFRNWNTSHITPLVKSDVMNLSSFYLFGDYVIWY